MSADESLLGCALMPYAEKSMSALSSAISAHARDARATYARMASLIRSAMFFSHSLMQERVYPYPAFCASHIRRFVSKKNGSMAWASFPYRPKHLEKCSSSASFWRRLASSIRPPWYRYFELSSLAFLAIADSSAHRAFCCWAAC